MKKQILQTGLALAAVSFGTLAYGAEVSPTDPVPNTQGEGGIGYHWTVAMGVKDSATLEGVVGAWSWDEDGFPATAKGWTHTSNWIAFELTKEVRLSITLQRKAGVATPFGVTPSNPDGVGLFNLFPALTIYQGWQNSGPDAHNFNNRGDIVWAGDVRYLTHVENDGSHVLKKTFRLPAGKYSINMGGNSPSTNAEGFQGYQALLKTDYPHDASKLIIPGSNRHMTYRRSYKIKGRISNPKSADKIYIKLRGKKLIRKPKGRNFSATVRKLRKGRNRVRVTLYSQEGISKHRKNVQIHRVTPVIPAPKITSAR